MDFNTALQRYEQLRQQYATSQITPTQFEQQVSQLQVIDEDGTYWQIGVDSGQWYCFDGSQWLQAEPPLPQPGAPPAPPEQVSQSQTYGYPAAPEGLQAHTAPPTKNRRLWILGLGGLLLVGGLICVAILGLAFLSNPPDQLTALVDPASTPAPNMTVVALQGTQTAIAQLPTATATSNPNAILAGDPQDYLLNAQHFPTRYTLDTNTAVPNDGVIVGRADLGLDGQAYLQATNRVTGWFSRYQLEDTNQPYPNWITQLVVLYKDRSGAQLAQGPQWNSDYASDYRVFNENPGIGDQSVIFETTYTYQNQTYSVYSLEFCYRNLLYILTLDGLQEYTTDSLLIELGEAALAGLQSAQLSSPGSLAIPPLDPALAIQGMWTLENYVNHYEYYGPDGFQATFVGEELVSVSRYQVPNTGQLESLSYTYDLEMPDYNTLLLTDDVGTLRHTRLLEPYPGPEILYFDDFADPQLSEFEEFYEGQHFTTTLVDNTYAISVESENFLTYYTTHELPATDDINLRVAIEPGNAPSETGAGIVCRLDSEKENFYYAVLSFDGYYAIGKYKNGELANDSFGWQPSTAINKGKFNLLSVFCVGDTISLFINNEYVTTYFDDEFTSGAYGLAASTEADQRVPATVYFDNFAVLAAQSK